MPPPHFSVLADTELYSSMTGPSISGFLTYLSAFDDFAALPYM